MPSPSPLPNTLFDDVQRALREDIQDGDITAALIPESEQSLATVISRENATLCGCAWFDEVFQQLAPAVSIEWHAMDGDRITANQKLCTLSGPARSILTGERTALNFLQTLSATATQTHQYVDAIEGTSCTILDTRKTLPGLRMAQKYAVTCGGGQNHRFGLYDRVLIKENHIMAAGSIDAAVKKARELSPGVKVEVEVENLDEFNQALASKADIVMLDNMPNEMLKLIVELNNGQCKLEASGGVNLQTIRAIAETGVDYVSVGMLTKDIKALDLSMRFQIQGS